MSGPEIDPDTLAALQAAGLSEDQARAFARAEAARARDLGGPSFVDVLQGRRSVTLAHAARELRRADAPASLVLAYAEAGATPARIVRDLVMHTKRGTLAPHVARTLEIKLQAERSTPAALWAHINGKR